MTVIRRKNDSCQEIDRESKRMPTAFLTICIHILLKLSRGQPRSSVSNEYVIGFSVISRGTSWYTRGCTHTSAESTMPVRVVSDTATESVFKVLEDFQFLPALNEDRYVRAITSPKICEGLVAEQVEVGVPCTFLLDFNVCLHMMMNLILIASVSAAHWYITFWSRLTLARSRSRSR